MENTAILKTTDKPRLSVKAQTLATIAAIVGAVAVPQIFHGLGAVSGLGTALGEAFLPMHLPIILVGLLAGPYAGAIAGLMRNMKIPAIAKVIIVQIAGRAVRAAAILFAVYALGSQGVSVASIWMSIGTGICGIVLQWALLPLIVYRVENLKKHEN